MIVGEGKTNYGTFYTKEGIKVKIKCNNDALCKSGNFVLRVKNSKTGELFYHSPNRNFDSVIDVIDFILRNVENKNLKFTIL